MQEFGTLYGLEVGQYGNQGGNVMSVDRSEITEIHGFEQVAGLGRNQGPHGPAEFADEVLGMALAFGIVTAHHVPHAVFELVVGFGGFHPREIPAQGPGAYVDGHAVVVENHQQVAFGSSGVVQAFECHTPCHGPVSDDGDMLPVFFPLQVGCDGHSQGRRDGSGRMPCAESIVFAFVARGESAQTAQATDGRELLLASGQNLMAVSLMPHIPDDTVVGRIENIMQGHGQLDGPQRGS